MKRYVVGMLAVFSLAGCGLEIDECLEGCDGSGDSSVDALQAQRTLAPGDGGAAGTGTYVQGAMPLGVSTVAYDPRGLPQDPVPVKPEREPNPGWPGTSTR